MFEHDKFEEGNNLIEDSSVENQSLFNDIIVDLLKRKITKENSLKNQIETNKRQLLEKFYSIETNSNKNESEIHKSNNIKSDNNNENNFNFKEAIFNAIKNTTSSQNKYEEMKEMYKKERDKKKSSIFKSEDLLISNTDSVHLKNEEFSPINPNVNDENKNNIIIIQKKLFENNDIESPPKQTIDELDTINFTSIDIKETDEDDPFLNNLNQLKIQKVFEFYYFGKPKKSSRKINERKNLLSMQMVAKIDYASQNSNNNNQNNENININNNNNNNNNNYTSNNNNVLNNNYSKKHNKTQSSNIVMGKNSNFKNLLMLQNNVKNPNLKNHCDLGKNQSPKLNNEKKIYIEQQFQKKKNVLDNYNAMTNHNLSFRNNSQKKKSTNILYNFNTNIFKNNKKNENNRPSTTKNLNSMYKIAQNLILSNNKNSILNSLISNTNIKFSKLSFQVDAINTLKKIDNNSQEIYGGFIILVEKLKENLFFKGIYQYRYNNEKNLVQKIFSVNDTHDIININNYKIFEENEYKKFIKVKKNILNTIGLNKTLIMYKD